MTDAAPIPWMRRPGLIVRPVGDKGQHVVKDPGNGNYFNLGEQEVYLLQNLDGRQTVAGLCAGFTDRFGEPFTEADLVAFLEIACAQGLVQAVRPAATAEEDTSANALPPPPRPARSILCWRKRVIDPDRFLTWLAPRMRWCYTRPFLALSLAGMAAAGGVLWANRQDLVSSFAHAMRWETVALVWVTIVVVTTFHEFAHGLTCKHFGGEVHEIGVLFLLFLPCLYCNVSDSWLFREKAKRLWVTLAGGYCDLCQWTLAVFAWRLTVPDSLLNYLSYVLLTVLGARVFFNFNPLIRLDGYYFLSDLVGVPNLQSRALGQFKGHLRWLLWGATRPASVPRGRLLLIYGGLSWSFSVFYLALMLVGLAPTLKHLLGMVGVLAVTLLGGFVMRGYFRDLFGGELRKMLLLRHKRTALWCGGLATVVGLLWLVRVEDRVGGSFQFRPVVRAEVRAPVAGFLRAVAVEEGTPVAAGAVVARLEVPNLASRIAQKQAEVREAEARLRLVAAGPRPEEVEAQRRRVDRANSWCEQAERNRERARQTLEEELGRLDRQVDQFRAEVNYAADVRSRGQTLRINNAISEEQFREDEKRWRCASAQLAQVQAQRRARELTGTREEETEAARRQKELADAQAALTLLECGSRPEERDAARALVTRLNEELHYLEQSQGQTSVASPVAGIVTTPHLADRVGQYVREGEVICLIEEPSALEAEITLGDEEMARVRVGQEVELKARPLPFRSFRARVDRVAPRVLQGDQHSTVTVYCKVEGTAEELRPGMAGHARIGCGRRPLGAIWADRLLRFLRTEFW
jgi:multidrug efflux pump subunit AcrA (membrane-fusion protein)